MLAQMVSKFTNFNMIFVFQTASFFKKVTNKFNSWPSLQVGLCFVLHALKKTKTKFYLVVRKAITRLPFTELF